MVWLNAANENGSGLYLNIHRMEERTRSTFALHGTVGDGFYEGEVLIEVGTGVDVTFADAWLDHSSLEEFFRRVDRGDVEAALAERASELLSGGCDIQQLGRRQEKRGRIGSRPGKPEIKEEGPQWKAA